MRLLQYFVLKRQDIGMQGAVPRIRPGQVQVTEIRQVVSAVSNHVSSCHNCVYLTTEYSCPWIARYRTFLALPGDTKEDTINYALSPGSRGHLTAPVRAALVDTLMDCSIVHVEIPWAFHDEANMVGVKPQHCYRKAMNHVIEKGAKLRTLLAVAAPDPPQQHANDDQEVRYNMFEEWLKKVGIKCSNLARLAVTKYTGDEVNLGRILACPEGTGQPFTNLVEVIMQVTPGGAKTMLNKLPSFRSLTTAFFKINVINPVDHTLRITVTGYYNQTLQELQPAFPSPFELAVQGTVQRQSSASPALPSIQFMPMVQDLDADGQQPSTLNLCMLSNLYHDLTRLVLIRVACTSNGDIVRFPQLKVLQLIGIIPSHLDLIFQDAIQLSHLCISEIGDFGPLMDAVHSGQVLNGLLVLEIVRPSDFNVDICIFLLDKLPSVYFLYGARSWGWGQGEITNFRHYVAQWGRVFVVNFGNL